MSVPDLVVPEFVKTCRFKLCDEMTLILASETLVVRCHPLFPIVPLIVVQCAVLVMAATLSSQSIHSVSLLTQSGSTHYLESCLGDSSVEMLKFCDFSKLVLSKRAEVEAQAWFAEWRQMNTR